MLIKNNPLLNDRLFSKVFQKVLTIGQYSIMETPTLLGITFQVSPGHIIF